MQIFTLLERLADPLIITHKTVRTDGVAQLASIGHNLERNFHTRIGSVQAPMDFGLLPPNELIPHWPDSSADRQREIDLCLKKNTNRA